MPLTDEVRRMARETAEGARWVSIDVDALESLDPGAPPELDRERHYLDGSADQVAHYLLVLDSINFGSGWFPTLRKRPGMSGYFTVASALTDFWRTDGGWSAGELRALRVEDIAPVLGQDPRHELMSLYAEALRALHIASSQPLAAPLAVVEERISDHEIGTQVGVGVGMKRVAPLRT